MTKNGVYVHELPEVQVPQDIEVKSKKNKRYTKDLQKIYRGSTEDHMAPKQVHRFLFIVSIACAIPAVTGSPYCDAGPCNKGQHYDDSGQCVDCPPDTYMDRTGHACASCLTCTNVIPGSHEITDTPCLPYSDAVIICEDQFYMVPDRDPRANGVCEPCRVCGYDEWEKRACSKYSNTLCCSKDVEVAHGECQDTRSENQQGTPTNHEQYYKGKMEDEVWLYVVIPAAFLIGTVLSSLLEPLRRRLRNRAQF